MSEIIGYVINVTTKDSRYDYECLQIQGGKWIGVWKIKLK